MQFRLPSFLPVLFPTARKRVTWWAAVPLLGFLVVYGAVCFALEWRGMLRFTYRPAFALLFLTPWFWWMSVVGGSGLGGVRATVALLTRLAIFGAFVMLLAEPRAVRKSDTLSVVYALDVSDSMGEKVSDQALAWIMQSLQHKPEKDEAGLVVFGREAAVELPPRKTFPFETINSRVGRDGSDLAKGLGLAAAMLPEGNQGRIVLVSDGNETEGAAAGMLDELKSRGVAVDVLPVGFDFAKEVWIERLDLPRVVKAGETYEASVLLNALTAGQGNLRLQENGKTIFEKPVEYAPGKNRYTLPLYMREPGYYEYVATIEPPKGEDGWTENNVAIGDLFLRGEGKVLVVTDAEGDPRDWTQFVSALKSSERVVQSRMAYEFPREPLSLLPYDLVVFPNVPADAFDAVQLQALRDAVYHQGTGFLMLGGPNSYGPGGFHRSAVEEALPVEMDVKQKKVLPKGALAIILHTCEFAEGNTWAKRVAKEAVRVLGAQDDVGLLAYTYTGGGGDQWIFKLTPAGQYEKLAVLINQAEPGDMPSFQPSMQMAFDALRANDASVKHAIVISDGDPSPPTPQLVQAYVDAKITISMIAINPHGQVDVSVMQSIAAATGGRYYFPKDPAQLPSIFIKEAKTLKRSMIQNKVFIPEIVFPSPILKGLDALPELRGYVLTTPKPRATLVLRAPPNAAEAAQGDEPDPLLATWRFGLGTTGAWTSDLAPNWAASWVEWEKYQAFVKQLAIELSRVEQKSDLHLRTFASGGMGVVSVEDFAQEDTFLDLAAKVSGPRGETATVALKQVAPRRYQGTFPLWGKGRYQVMAAGLGTAGGKERNEQALGGFAVPYSPEYLRFRSDPILLKNIAERTGGRVLGPNESNLFQRPRTIRESTRPVFDWFLLALAILVPLDVGIRRVQLDWALIAGWFRRRERESSGETFGALLQRKQQVKETLEAPRGERPPPVRLPVRTKPAANPTPGAPQAARPASGAGDDPKKPVSTTERLLARKRKRQEDQE